jgi:hypothetical protein
MRPSSAFALLACFVLHLETAACSPGGGCYWHQTNFQVTPPESCVQTAFQTCDATDSVTLVNGCSDTLVVDYSDTDSGLSTATLAPGTQQQIIVRPFVSNGQHVRIPATLGTTTIVISYDVT